MSSQSHSAVRNPRRRRRADEDGGSTRQQPQRKRTKISEDTKQLLAETEASKDGYKINGHMPTSYNDRSHLGREIAVRGKPHSAMSRRPVKDDGAIILARNPCYEVKQLAGLPENLRSSQSNVRGELLRSGNFALALTPTEAVTWDYTSTSSAPSSRTFTLPHPSSPGQPLPIGTFVHTTQAAETGLVVINATSGRITYWESVENADALSLFEQRRNGVEGSCGSLSSGEYLVEIVPADHAGFVLIFSSGRTAQLLLRDAQAKPLIKVNFFRSQQAAAGLFGGIRSALGGGGWVRNVTTAKTRPALDRGNMEAILVTEDAQIHFWLLNISGQPTQRAEVNARHEINSAVSRAFRIDEAKLEYGREADVKMLDMAIVSTNASTTAVASTNSEQAFQDVDLVVLVNAVGSGYSEYAIVEVQIVDGQPSIRRTIALNSYTEPLFTKSAWRPRLSLSPTSATAFVLFDKAITLVSLATLHVSPDTQLMIDSETSPEPFQDTIYLREDSDCSIVGASAESGSIRSTQCSALVLVKGCGLLRIIMAEPVEEQRAVVRTKLFIKDKLEQAVYFSTLPGNPLDLARKSTLDSDVEDVEIAAIEISREVCGSDSSFIAAVAPSMEVHLEQRARVLRELATILKRTYADISRITRWRLRWDAEKMAAAQKVWSSYETKAKRGDDSQLLLPAMLALINEEGKTEIDPKKGERDQVRQWFLKDVWRMENLAAWSYRALWEMEKENEVNDQKTYYEMLSDADDIVIEILSTAFAFRAESAALYGLDKETLNDGVLKEGYEGLPEFWTSTAPFVAVLAEHIGQARSKVLDASPSDEEEALVVKIAGDQPTLVDLFCKVSTERYLHLLTSTNDKERKMAEPYRQQHRALRSKMMVSLADLELAVDGMSLAEKYRDMSALVQLVKTQLTDELMRLAEGEGDELAHHHVQTLEKRINRYFNEYGAAWATPFYSDQISRRAYSRLWDQSPAYQRYFTDFLRAEPKRLKLSWINDIVTEKDFSRASRSLLDVAEGQEQDLWSKKVELSLAKLTLAVNNKIDVGSIAHAARQQDALALVNIQDKIYEHIRPSLYSAVDQAAELQIAMETFGRHVVKGKPASHSLLERGFESLIQNQVMNADLLVDLLTLMDQHPTELRQHDICGSEFVLALQAFAQTAKTRSTQNNELLLKIIWRRCFIRDGWKVLDAAAKKSDQEATTDLEATVLFKTIYGGYEKGLWHDNSVVQMLPPAEVLGAGASPDDLRERFSTADLRGPIAKDMAAEDTTLKNYIDHSRLEHWFTSAQAWAKEKLQRDQKKKVELEHEMQQMMESIENEDEELQSMATRVERPAELVNGASA